MKIKFKDRAAGRFDSSRLHKDRNQLRKANGDANERIFCGG